MDSERLCVAIQALVELVARLRSPGGCPWDAQQTDSSVKIYLLEEAYEVLEAVDRSSPQDVCLELGDLLFQILFLARMAAERKEFDFTDVLEKITEKMIRRHPHVFGRTHVDDAKEVAANWSKIKRVEKGIHEEMSAGLKSVPDNLPALLRAHRLAERAAKLNPHWDEREDSSGRLVKQMEILKEAITGHDRDSVRRETGDLLFTLVDLMRQWDLNAENALRSFNQKFVARIEGMEHELNACGIKLEDATADQMNAAWEKTKAKVWET